MNKPTLLSLLLLGTAAGAGGGYWFARQQAGQVLERERTRLVAERDEARQRATAKAAEDPTAATAASKVTAPPGWENLSLAEIMAAAGPMERFQAIMAYVQNMPKNRIEEALNKVRTGMQGRFDPESMFAMHLLLTRYGTEDSGKALSYLKSLDLMTQGFGTSTVLASMASKDPAAAAKYFEDAANPLLNVPMASGFMAGSVAKEWAKQDPEAALAWAKGLGDNLRGGALSSLISSVAVDDPKKAAGMLDNLAAGEERTRVAGQLAETWAAKSPTEALAWAQGLSGEERTKAIGDSLKGWAGQDPASAAAWAANLSDVKEKDAALGAVAGPWARRDPASAADWVGGQAEGKGKESAVRDVMWMWSATEPEKASAWLNEQPAGPSKDEGIMTMGMQIFGTDPEGALTWGSTISDPGKRDNAVTRGAEQWLKKDRPAAETWIQTSPVLSPEKRQKLLGGS